MKRLAVAVKGDVLLQIKYGFYAIYAIITTVYIIILRQLPYQSLHKAIPFIVFSDPSFLGFFFIGGLILLEKGENTLEFLVVTPLRIKEYLLSKMISLTLLAALTSYVISIFSYGLNFNKLLFTTGIILTSFFFILIGFIAVARFQTVNGYLLTAIGYITVMSIPLLGYFGLYKNWLFYLLPTQASLILIDGAFAPKKLWEVLYAYSYLGICIILAYRLAYRLFNKYIILREGEG